VDALSGLPACEQAAGGPIGKKEKEVAKQQLIVLAQGYADEEV
jgi:hypothetical protein